MIDFNEFVSLWQLDEPVRRTLAPQWEALNAQWGGKSPQFMDLAWLEKFFPLLKAPCSWQEFRPCAEAVIAAAKAEPKLAFYVWLVWHGEFEMTPALHLGKPADPCPLLGDNVGALAVMIALGALPLMTERCRSMGIPEQYALDAIAWMGGTMIAYGIAHEGQFGRPFEFGWIRHHVDGKLFRIGRLEYLVHTCIDWMPPVFCKDDGSVIALCNDDWRFDDNGEQVNRPKPARYVTRLIETAETVTGTPIRPDGTVDFGKTVTLDRRQWKSAASAWTLCPSMHIPAGCRMPFEEIKASMIAARKFFADYFHRDVPFFCCCSWILNPAWDELLPDSNMVRFRREGYAIPSPDWGKEGGTSFLFGRGDRRPEEMKATNRAQKAMQEASRRNQNGYGVVFYLARDLEKLGNEYYRNHIAGEAAR